MPVAPMPKPTSTIGGLDMLRLLAIVMVTTKHALSLNDHDEWTRFGTLGIGTLGVAIFLGISALLASVSTRDAVPWLAKRLLRLYPAYWLTMIFSFVIVWFVGYKPFDTFQIIAQMLGVGMFTHGDKLINVPTWFISVILICYLVLFLGKLTRRPLAINLLMLAIIIPCVAVPGLSWPCMMRLTTFFTVATLTLVIPAARRPQGFLASGLAVSLASPISVAYAYTGITLILIGIFALIPVTPRFTQVVSRYSFEYYLIHGIFLIGAFSMLRGRPMVAFVIGVMSAAVAAVILHHLAAWITGHITSSLRRPSWIPSRGTLAAPGLEGCRANP